MTEGKEHPIVDPNQSQREAVRRGIAQFQQRLQAAGHDFREPPPEPTSCCGRGCNGCVWEGYDAALMFWYEDAGALLARVTTFTTIAGAEAAVEGMKYMDKLDVISVQEMHAMLTA